MPRIPAGSQVPLEGPCLVGFKGSVVDLPPDYVGDTLNVHGRSYLPPVTCYEEDGGRRSLSKHRPHGFMLILRFDDPPTVDHIVDQS